jgi:pimeloyl-ACP methyl ester carboxylesterase
MERRRRLRTKVLLGFESDFTIKKIDVPSLVMHGEDDQIVPVKTRDSIHGNDRKYCLDNDGIYLHTGYYGSGMEISKDTSKKSVCY